MSFIKKLFAEAGARDVVTLFHKQSSPASIRVHTILKQAAATAAAHSTEDQASSHESQSKAERVEFDLDVVEQPPTSDQLKSILEYLGSGSAGKVVKGASDEGDALKKLKQNGDAFQRPVVVNWNKGKAVMGENESEILRLLKEIPEETKS
ncbi:hypothetical protein M501DRAFT_1003325 [Patellaria atrata CBS 101060]|uniref:DUF1687-domain-containing protein n=1 Tax=Patellaria atrata CBS 101060 TaxID=1346257 RepID=A0A9P4VTR9_9PEZI|nr:hypothetical protein M501DRAFT_1003325 [Patellaria atrata CBS 101060]